MQEALNKASVYIDRRIMDGSKPSITLPHAEHILIVAIAAAVIARIVKQDDTCVEQAFVCGLLHDIGRYIVDEKAAKYPHTIAGYERCKKFKITSVAQVCLTHSILDGVTKQEYPDYTEEQLDWVNKKMTTINRNFYDDLVMLIDLHCRGNQVFTIKDRLEKNKSFYNIHSDHYCEKYLNLQADFVNKYHVDIYQVCRYVVEHKQSLFRKLMPYCHGWLRYVCGDESVVNEYPLQLQQQLLGNQRQLKFIFFQAFLPRFHAPWDRQHGTIRHR